jgi:hypothetical protein
LPKFRVVGAQQPLHPHRVVISHHALLAAVQAQVDVVAGALAAAAVLIKQSEGTWVPNVLTN